MPRSNAVGGQGLLLVGWGSPQDRPQRQAAESRTAGLVLHHLDIALLGKVEVAGAHQLQHLAFAIMVVASESACSTLGCRRAP